MQSAHQHGELVNIVTVVWWLRARRVHAFASAAAQIPLTVIDSAAWSLVTYFMWGLSTSGAGYFFTHWLILIAVSNCCGCLFRLIAHLAPDGVAANSYGGVSLLILIVMSGFTIVRLQIPPWWIWAYYLSPFAWALRSIVISEWAVMWRLLGNPGTVPCFSVPWWLVRMPPATMCHLNSSYSLVNWNVQEHARQLLTRTSALASSHILLSATARR